MALKLKVLKFLNITETGVIKKVVHNPIIFKNYAAAYYQTLEEVPGPLLPEKAQKQKNCRL